MLDELSSRISQTSFLKDIIEGDKVKASPSPEQPHRFMFQCQVLENQLTILKYLKNEAETQKKIKSSSEFKVGDFVLYKEKLYRVEQFEEVTLKREISYHIYKIVSKENEHIITEKISPVPDTYWKTQKFEYGDKVVRDTKELSDFDHGSSPGIIIHTEEPEPGGYRILYKSYSGSGNTLSVYTQPENIRPAIKIN